MKSPPRRHRPNGRNFSQRFEQRGIFMQRRVRNGASTAARGIGRRSPASSRPRRASAPGPSSGGATLVLYELTRFGIKQGWACLFGALMLALLIGTHLLYPEGRLALPLRFPGARGGRHPGRHAGLQARDLGGGQGHLHLPRGRHGHGDLQDLGGLLDLSGGVHAAHRRRAAVHRLHVCGHRLLHRPLLAAVRLPLHASSAAVGAGAAGGRHLRQLLRPPLRVGRARAAVRADRAAASGAAGCTSRCGACTGACRCS